MGLERRTDAEKSAVLIFIATPPFRFYAATMIWIHSPHHLFSLIKLRYLRIAKGNYIKKSLAKINRQGIKIRTKNMLKTVSVQALASQGSEIALDYALNRHKLLTFS